MINTQYLISRHIGVTPNITDEMFLYEVIEYLRLYKQEREEVLANQTEQGTTNLLSLIE